VAIPKQELDTLQSAIQDAEALAGEGNVVEGYSRLYTAFREAEERTGSGERWAAALLRQYQEALLRYSERTGKQRE
jgi:hypothetical protein